MVSLAQHPAGARPAHLGRLPRAGRADRDRGGAGRRGQPHGERAGLLRGRHAARERARGAGRAWRPLRRQRDVPHDDARLRRSRRDRRLRLARVPRARASRRCWRGSACTAASSPSAFASLRANDLVWNYVVNNYLKGETPPAFDLLHWNGDSANLPGPMYAYYLREHVPRQPAARARRADDARRAHRPWALRHAGLRPRDARGSHRALALAYRTPQLVGGDAQFVLGASGHIAGVVNPPSRRAQLLGQRARCRLSRRLARRARERMPGSWWPHWDTWLARHGGRRARRPQPQATPAHPPLDAGPGPLRSRAAPGGRETGAPRARGPVPGATLPSLRTTTPRQRRARGRRPAGDEQVAEHDVQGAIPAAAAPAAGAHDPQRGGTDGNEDPARRTGHRRHGRPGRGDLHQARRAGLQGRHDVLARQHQGAGVARRR